MNDMTTRQQVAANYMTAVAHLLTGSAGRRQEFIEKVNVMVGGSNVHLMNLMLWGDHVQRTGRPIMHFSASHHSDVVPQVSLVAHLGGRNRIFENCSLWLGKDDDRAHLVPDSFKFGAYVLDDDLVLRELKRPPVKGGKKAESGMVRAYRRLLDLQAEHWENRAAHPVPQLLPERKAA